MKLLEKPKHIQTHTGQYIHNIYLQKIQRIYIFVYSFSEWEKLLVADAEPKFPWWNPLSAFLYRIDLLCVKLLSLWLMLPRALTMGVIFASHTGVRILANILLLLCYGLLSCTGWMTKQVYWILHNLILDNCLVFLWNGFLRQWQLLGWSILWMVWGAN